ncbi:MAG TPA: hypothetical protein VFQ91_03530 [Bryobacteraceae bacterium]|nr:hypothetical protein [Bryobacteraceae bacterium]
MFCHVGGFLFPILLASLAGAQPVSSVPNKQSYHVYVLDIEEGRKLFEKLTVADASQATDWKTAAGKIEKIVGRF